MPYARLHDFLLKCLFRLLTGQNGGRVNVAVKTCKDCSPDVMEKFMSEAGDQTRAENNETAVI